MVKTCRACQVVGPVPKQEPIKRTQLPDGPWQDLCADLMGPFPTDPLFFKENGNALDRDFVIRSLRHVLDICGYNSSLYNGHSFRIGASTSVGSVNIQDHLIKTLGRWRSDSYCRYIRISKDTIRKAQKS
ncbi:Hypothetical predicted protein [Mytilus galloprovincialis]|uniref:Tyr recombinase domain-containing protein n=1 Tax=Mytilus galloprovincialis TaxID=29158 RepID=A0A8B6EZK6_MYTGA|nr:Hypothetical predicted protein [Mytilus galloprovincialis]